MLKWVSKQASGCSKVKVNLNSFVFVEVEATSKNKLFTETSSSSKSVQSHFSGSLTGDKVMSHLKFKLANIIKCGAVGNDNSSDSGYEEVAQDSSGKIILPPSMPPPPQLQSL